VEPCVFGGFLFADLFEDGVGDGLLVAALVVLLVPLVADGWQDARNAMPTKTAIKKNTCLLIGYIHFASCRVGWLLKANH